MLNREKIIKGLECCIERKTECRFANNPCPYVPYCQSYQHEKLKQDALELITNKGIKPDKQSEYKWYCGNCGCRIHLKTKPKYCCKCGIRIDKA